MRKWHRFIPAASAVTAITVITEILSAGQKF